MADILEESRNPASTAYQSSHKNDSKGRIPLKKDNDSSKDSDNSKARGKGKKFIPRRKGQGQGNSQNKNRKGPFKAEFSCAITNYNLATGGYSSDEPELLSNSDSDLDVDLALNNSKGKGYKRPKDHKERKKSLHIRDSLLYDTGSSVHIINNRK